jgi:threonylcarbamoyladenosine tRNA methylthiotransferase MtaB
MPHLHLSLQAGNDLVLKRMKRRHSCAGAVAFCDEARRLRPDMAFGADLIAGFPTETEAMFEDTERLVDDCGLAFLHVFPFSPRPGTPAARMPQVRRETVKARAARLRAKGRSALGDFLARQAGREVEVLIERDRIGRTPQFAEAAVTGLMQRAGAVANARVTGHDGQRLLAEAVA